LYVLTFFLAFFLLMSSGRLASSDAGAQLQAAMLLVNTGSLSTATPPADQGLWVMNSEGRYYQAHDIGNIVLMLPAAWIGSVITKQTGAEFPQEPPLISKVGVALTYACLSALGCFYLFLTFSLFYKQRPAFLLSLAFVLTTFFWAYTKSAWDVLGAACFVCLLLYFASRIVLGAQSKRIFFITGLVLAAACSFRFSLTPFLALSLGGVLFFSRVRFGWLITASSFALGLVPDLFYNYLRMGTPFQPATTAPKYLALGNNLSGNMFTGLYGLIASPNKGLLVFAPIFVLLFFLPFVWKELSSPVKLIIACFGVGAFLHILMLSKLTGWGSFGWGPRYLVTLLPVLFFIVAAVLMSSWGKHRNLLIGLLCISTLVNLPTAFVNWHLAITEYPEATNQYALRPFQHEAIWNGLFLGLRGQPLPAPADFTQDPIRRLSAVFPDLWTIRLMKLNNLYLVLGLAITLFLLAVIGWSSWRILKIKDSPQSKNPFNPNA
jgi:hypothetical protein